MKPRARIDRSDLCVVIFAPYNAIFVQTIKAGIPSFARRYDPELKSWRVDTLYADEVIAITRTYFEIVITDTRRQASGAGWAVLMFTTLPERLQEPVYRALVRILHPDAGGDTAATQQLNHAYDQSRGVR